MRHSDQYQTNDLPSIPVSDEVTDEQLMAKIQRQGKPSLTIMKLRKNLKTAALLPLLFAASLANATTTGG